MCLSVCLYCVLYAITSNCYRFGVMYASGGIIYKKCAWKCVSDEDARNIKFKGPCCTSDGSYNVIF